jgi:hypothetical protein
MAECLLRKANGRPDTLCDDQACAFWRMVDHVGVAADADWSGCAIQHFALLDGGEDLAAWLLSAKERAEAAATARGVAAVLAPDGRTSATADVDAGALDTRVS